MIRVTAEVICDLCSNQNDDFGISADDARRGAHSDGWHTTRRDGRQIDICPACQADEFPWPNWQRASTVRLMAVSEFISDTEMADEIEAELDDRYRQAAANRGEMNGVPPE